MGRSGAGKSRLLEDLQRRKESFYAQRLGGLGALAPNGPNALSAGQAGAANGGALENRPGLGRPGAEPEELTRRLLFLLYLIGL